MKNSIRLVYPFYGHFPVTFTFGAKPMDETIRKKYQDWGLAGHNGIDFGLPEGTYVLAAASGLIVQAGDNGDFGMSITILHLWGVSMYAHLSQIRVALGSRVAQGSVVGLSGKTGTAAGAHLHFAIKPKKVRITNGFLGFIDPSPYFISL